jgi:poly-beta-1,6-N-acetyl-D-glucosamine biosynthesis protein PgaD
MKQLIIDRPDLQNTGQRFGFGLLTLALWIIYLYLWLPLLTLGAWGMQARFAYEHMVVLGGYRGLLQVLGLYLLVIFSIGVVLVAWSRSNLLRFRGADRRKSPLPVTPPQVAARFEVPKAVLMSWYVGKSVVIHHNDAGDIVPSTEVIDRMQRVAVLVNDARPGASAPQAARSSRHVGGEHRWGGLRWPA